MNHLPSLLLGAGLGLVAAHTFHLSSGGAASTGAAPLSPATTRVVAAGRGPKPDVSRTPAVGLSVDAGDCSDGSSNGQDAKRIGNVGSTPAPSVLLSALIAVESGGDRTAVGDRGQAVGVLQIHPIMVEDCNRILGRDEFTLADRLSPERSVAMFNVWRAHYCKDASDEVVARRWNSGPKGDRKARSLPYWAKVRKEMEAR